MTYYVYPNNSRIGRLTFDCDRFDMMTHANGDVSATFRDGEKVVGHVFGITAIALKADES